MAVSPDGRSPATVGTGDWGDWTVRIWEQGSETPVAAMRTDASPHSCCFLPDNSGPAVAGLGGPHGYTFDFGSRSEARPRRDLDIVRKPGGQRGFLVQPKRWAVERAFSRIAT